MFPYQELNRAGEAIMHFWTSQSLSKSISSSTYLWCRKYLFAWKDFCFGLVCLLVVFVSTTLANCLSTFFYYCFVWVRCATYCYQHYRSTSYSNYNGSDNVIFFTEFWMIHELEQTTLLLLWLKGWISYIVRIIELLS